MIQQEVYFIHVNGSQRGPYTSRQICHLVNSGLVPNDALFWCEGMDQWQPVDILLDPAAPSAPTRRKWRQIALVSALALLAVSWLVGPTLRRGWKEERQVERTPEAVYWRARGVAREALRGSGLVNFAQFTPETVRSLQADLAEVVLSGTLVNRSGEKPTRWLVHLKYDQKLKSWGPDESPVTEEPIEPQASATAENPHPTPSDPSPVPPPEQSSDR